MNSLALMLVISFLLLTYMIIQAYLIKFFFDIYQTLREKDSISELRGDESVMEETPPPYDTLQIDENRGSNDV